jgi:tryptophan synthase alpha chain
MLQNDIHRALEKQDILLMTHLVLGYPSFAVNRQVVKQMAAAGVELIELQIPFSEPVADGPVIARARRAPPWRSAGPLPPRWRVRTRKLFFC